MAFRVAARVILELGAELIGSDAVALYELIKNSVDAESKWVSINVQIVLARSRYLESMESLDEGEAADSVRKTLFSNLDPTAPRAARKAFHEAILAAGNDRRKLKRALQTVYHDLNWIEVADRGIGMNRRELQDVFLTIGTRSRRGEKVDRRGQFLDPGRVVLGDKGVGRLSAMRLGEHMLVSTTRAGELYQNVLDIDWTKFSHDSADMIEDIDILPARGERKDRRSQQGTTILIRNLRGDWDRLVFARMVEEQFKRLVDPFPTSKDEPYWKDPNKLFRLKFNGRKHQVPEIPLWLLEQAHAVVTARFEADVAGVPRLSGHIDYRLRGRERTFELIEQELMSLTDPIADQVIRTGPSTLRNLGSFTVRFYWYNRRLLKEVSGIGNRQFVLDSVNSWAGGIMVFRDCFRINPYGGQDDDWLELDKKALSARAYKVNRSQIVGAVNLSSRNIQLIEQTNRSGLADNEYKQVLVGMLRHLVISEFRTFITNVDKERKVTDETTTDDLDLRLDATRLEIERRIRDLKRAVPKHAKALAELQQLTINLGHLVDQAKAMAREYEDDRSKFVYLAGIGLLVEFVLHEIGRTTSRALSALADMEFEEFGPAGAATLETLQDQLFTLGKRIDNLDPLSTSRRQIRQRFDVREIVQQVIDSRSEQFARHGVKIRLGMPKKRWMIRAVKGMLLQILENLLENAVYWLKVEKRRDRKFRPVIEITVDAALKELVVEDNGPGVAIQRREEIFEPFVTSKPPGEGRGLGLYISREMARYHSWELHLVGEDEEEAGRSSEFVLEME